MPPEWPALVAILIWASLAAVSGGVLAAVPASSLVAVSLASAGVAFAGLAVVRGSGWRALVPVVPARFALGVVGIGGYHAAIFAAFALAPVLEANLLNYLWPLLTVLFAAPLAGERLESRAIGGAALGLCGTILVVGGGSARLDPSAIGGYACAAGAAVIWAGFTNLLKRLPLGPSDLASASLVSALAAALVAWQRGDLWPVGQALAAAVYLGALPIALATVFWEAGVRRGRVAVVGALAYLAPLLSTMGVWLVLGRPPGPGSLGGGALIVAGALLGTTGRRRA